MHRLASLLLATALLGMACATAPDALPAPTTTDNPPPEPTTTSAVAAPDIEPSPPSLEASESAWFDEVAPLHMPGPDDQLFTAYLVSWAHANEAETIDLLHDRLASGFAADNPTAVSTAPLDLYLAATTENLTPLLFEGVDSHCGVVVEILLNEHDQTGVDCLFDYYEQRKATQGQWFQPNPSATATEVRRDGTSDLSDQETSFINEVHSRLGIVRGQEQSMIDRGHEICRFLTEDTYDNVKEGVLAGVEQAGGNMNEGLAEAWLIVIDTAIQELCPEGSSLWERLQSDLGFDPDTMDGI